MLLLYLYTEKNINKDILLKTDKGELLYSNKGISKKTEYIEQDIPLNSSYLIVRYNKKRNKIKINPKYKYLYLEFIGKDFLEIVYSNEKPEFID